MPKSLTTSEAALRVNLDYQTWRMVQRATTVVIWPRPVGVRHTEIMQPDLGTRQTQQTHCGLLFRAARTL